MQGGIMAGNGKNQIQISTGPFVASGILVGLGGLLGFIGFVIGLLHLLNESTRFVGLMETPPNKLAKDNLNRLSMAAKAGGSAWRDYTASGTGGVN
jgi:hypothetical protein